MTVCTCRTTSIGFKIPIYWNDAKGMSGMVDWNNGKLDISDEVLGDELARLLKGKRRYPQHLYLPLAMRVFSDYPKSSRQFWQNELSLRILNHPQFKHDDAPEIPSDKTIRKWHDDLYMKLSSRAKTSLSEYRWPDSHNDGSLPMESAEIGLALLMVHKRRTVPEPIEPLTIAQVRWAYLLHKTRPTLPFDNRFGEWYFNLVSVSHDLALIDSTPNPEYLWRTPIGDRVSHKEMIMEALWYAPWESPEHRSYYFEDSRTRLRAPVAIRYIEGDDSTDANFLLSFVCPSDFGRAPQNQQDFEGEALKIINTAFYRGDNWKEAVDEERNLPKEDDNADDTKE